MAEWLPPKQDAQPSWAERLMGSMNPFGPEDAYRAWPAQAVRSLYNAATLPGDVYAGLVDPLSQEATNRAADLAGAVMLGSAPAAAAREGVTLGVGGGKLGRGLPMDEASRMARARDMGYAEEPFYRGEARGGAPNSYPDGAHFSRDQSYAQGFAEAGGQDAPREFRLNLGSTFSDGMDLTAEQYSRIIQSAAMRRPDLAAGLADAAAPGMTPDWWVEFAKRNPDYVVARNGGASLVRQMIKQADPSYQTIGNAGFNALDSGRDVHVLDGKGIRHKDAIFDPAKARSRNIFYGVGGAGIGGTLSGFSSQYEEMR